MVEMTTLLMRARMPEYTQEDVSGRPIIVRFKNDEDVQAFAKLIGQTITEKTKFIWYPYQGPESYTHLRYKSEVE